jgi:filamentous hemagglutinin
MNKRCYRLVFNKTRGLLMAVCELARSRGAAADGGLAFTSSAAHLPLARLRPLAFAALLLSGAQLLVIASTHAQIVADPSAPRTQQPVVLNTASGLPQVNITTPSAAGVSRNTYTQFDVNKPGAILNNARNDVQTQLGGWVQRNPNLPSGSDARKAIIEAQEAGKLVTAVGGVNRNTGQLVVVPITFSK